MWFLIGVVILIGFVIFCYYFMRNKIRKLSIKYLGTTNIKEILEKSQLEDEETPKSLSSMDSIYLEQIRRDFPDININELKRMSEKEILNTYKAIENKDSGSIKNGKVKSFVDSVIDDIGDDEVRYSDIKIHKTVVSKYEKSKGVATIYFSTAFQYMYKKGNMSIKKVQDRVKTEYIYVIDVNEVEHSKKVLGINCPNCGSPVISLGEKTCSYCGSGVIDIVRRVWTINDIVKY